MKRLAWALLALTFGAAPAVASGCRDLDHGGNRYTVCEVDAGAEDLRLFLYRPDGTPWGQFSAVNAALRPEGLTRTLPATASRTTSPECSRESFQKWSAGTVRDEAWLLLHCLNPKTL